jgi:hypothetical protein
MLGKSSVHPVLNINPSPNSTSPDYTGVDNALTSRQFLPQRTLDNLPIFNTTTPQNERATRSYSGRSFIKQIVHSPLSSSMSIRIRQDAPRPSKSLKALTSTFGTRPGSYHSVLRLKSAASALQRENRDSASRLGKWIVRGKLAMSLEAFHADRHI